jgi:predicted phosphodiesterase
MRALILSDIHGNLEALDAVLTAAAGQWDELWNLGDIVGYGGAPNQVLDRIRPLQTLVVRGNHDRVCCGLTSPNAFNPVARTAALWTQDNLTADNLAWLKELPQGPLSPMSHPRFIPPHAPTHSRARRTIDLQNRAESWTLTLEPGSRHLINPGSVGQPRDFDWRAAFAMLTITQGETGPSEAVRQITFHRVPYDVVSSQGRILMAGLPERLAARLREGR